MNSSPQFEDLRQPAIKRVPAGSYLITGLPRIRTAWLAALFSTETMPCYHEAPTQNMAPIDTHAPFGLMDPGAACLYPNRALKLFDKSKVVVIARPAKDSRRALEKLAGEEIKHWDELQRRYDFFVKSCRPVQLIKFADLGDYRVVRDLYRLLTNGGTLTRQRYDLFDGLRIEQDFVKRAEAERAA